VAKNPSGWPGQKKKIWQNAHSSAQLVRKIKLFRIRRRAMFSETTDGPTHYRQNIFASSNATAALCEWVVDPETTTWVRPRYWTKKGKI
jgi:hypothetical protein